MIVEALRGGHKVLFCGNGGSAADAQHLSAELSGRYAFDRAPLYAEALHVNTSYVTAVANDYSYDVIFSRMVAGCGRAGDVLVGLTTSGNSKNVILAAEEAQRLGMKVIGLTGDGGGKLGAVADVAARRPVDRDPSDPGVPHPPRAHHLWARRGGHVRAPLRRSFSGPRRRGGDRPRPRGRRPAGRARARRRGRHPCR